MSGSPGLVARGGYNTADRYLTATVRPRIGPGPTITDVCWGACDETGRYIAFVRHRRRPCHGPVVCAGGGGGGLRLSLRPRSRSRSRGQCREPPSLGLAEHLGRSLS